MFGLVVREESPCQTPADLKGTTLGVGTADGAEVGFIRAILSDLGMVAGEDYKFLPVARSRPDSARRIPIRHRGLLNSLPGNGRMAWRGGQAHRIRTVAGASPLACGG